MPKLLHSRAWKLSLALLLWFSALAAPAAAQEDNVATLDWVDAQYTESDCLAGGYCSHTVEATLRYQVPKPPGIIQCEIAGVEGTFSSEAIEFTDTSGTVTTSVTDPNPSKIGGDGIPAVGCVLEAEGVYLAVSPWITHAEIRVEGAAAPEQAAPSGELTEDIGELLAGLASPDLGPQDILDYNTRRGACSNEPDDSRNCNTFHGDLADGIVADFKESIGLIDGAQASESEADMIHVMETAALLATGFDPQERALYPGLQAGLDSLAILAERGAHDPNQAAYAREMLSLLLQVDIARGMRLAEPGDN